jgi:hypothetical protein
MIVASEKQIHNHPKEGRRPGAHVLDNFGLDLLLGQAKSKHRFLPGRVQPLLVELGQCFGPFSYAVVALLIRSSVAPRQSCPARSVLLKQRK